jgi:hypothetical protein
VCVQEDVVRTDEGNLLLHGEDGRGVAGTRVGTEDEEQVGKPGECCAVVGAGTAILRPVIDQVFAMFADDLVPRQLAVDVEAVGTHYDIGRNDTIFCPDALGDKLKERAVCQLNARVMEGLEIARVVDAPLAANLEVRNQHVMVTRWRCRSHVALDRLSSAFSQPVADGIHAKGRVFLLGVEVDVKSVELECTGYVAEDPLHELAVFKVHRCVDPLFAADDVGNLCGGSLSRKRCYDLNASTSVADHDDLLACKIDVVPPLSGVEHMPLEGLAALEDSRIWRNESSSAVEQDLAHVLRPDTGVKMLEEQCPSFRVVVPDEAFDFDFELHSLRYAILVGDRIKIAFQLTLGREQLRPAWVLFVAIRIESSGNITGAA